VQESSFNALSRCLTGGTEKTRQSGCPISGHRFKSGMFGNRSRTTNNSMFGSHNFSACILDNEASEGAKNKA
jgi:hypothetical protein